MFTKKRCRVCVDIAMDKFSKGATEIHNLTLDNNPCNPIVIVEDNVEDSEEIKDIESDVVSDVQMNQGVEEIVKLKDVESDVCSDLGKKVISLVNIVMILLISILGRNHILMLL